jgi:hypothetical protein
MFIHFLLLPMSGFHLTSSPWAAKPVDIQNGGGARIRIDDPQWAKLSKGSAAPRRSLIADHPWSGERFWPVGVRPLKDASRPGAVLVD